MFPIHVRHVSNSLCENDPKSVWCFFRANGEPIKVDPQHWYPIGSYSDMETLAGDRGFAIVGQE